MKKSIKLSALVLLLTAGLFAATTSIAEAAIVPSTTEVAFSALPSSNGIDVKVSQSEAGKTAIIIYDKDDNVLRKDVLTGATAKQGYILTSLENGDYTIEVTSNGKVVKQDVLVYNEGDAKMFIIKS